MGDRPLIHSTATHAGAPPQKITANQLGRKEGMVGMNTKNLAEQPAYQVTADGGPQLNLYEDAPAGKEAVDQQGFFPITSQPSGLDASLAGFSVNNKVRDQGLKDEIPANYDALTAKEFQQDAMRLMAKTPNGRLPFQVSAMGPIGGPPPPGSDAFSNPGPQLGGLPLQGNPGETNIQTGTNMGSGARNRKPKNA